MPRLQHARILRVPVMLAPAMWLDTSLERRTAASGADEMSDTRPMTAEQAEKLKWLAQLAYELDAFKPNFNRAEAALRIAALTAKLKLLDGPPHPL